MHRKFNYDYAMGYFTGLLSPLKSVLSYSGSSERWSSFIFSIFTIFIYYQLAIYILLNKMKVSKEDGTTPYYEFN